jgi:hypothetical protein
LGYSKVSRDPDAVSPFEDSFRAQHEQQRSVIRIGLVKFVQALSHFLIRQAVEKMGHVTQASENLGIAQG